MVSNVFFMGFQLVQTSLYKQLVKTHKGFPLDKPACSYWVGKKRYLHQFYSYRRLQYFNCSSRKYLVVVGSCTDLEIL